ncbi:MAG: aldehyde dehydrogenase family protein [Mucilaginibacter polytrichastri]|nr:aldehyde dehydrogenase family protein [Mucilaginibacter polytrichastri]
MQAFTENKEDLSELFLRQNTNKQFVKLGDAAARREKLRRLKSSIEFYEEAIYQALHSDLRKNRMEAALSEIQFIYSEIDFTLKNLARWMRPKKVAANRSNFLTKNRVVYEPKGLTLIMAPWNYPFQLLMSPLISAIAAGNCAILKPSEFAPATSAVMANLIGDTFQPEEIALIEGDAETAQTLLELPFDHIFYTGSTETGKKVMRAAAEHLASVTLELGGKSPVIIHSSADLKKTARKIAWGKWMNAGQTCIAPDYVFVHESQRDILISEIGKAVKKMYGDPLNTEDYGRMVNRHHFYRVRNLLDDATEQGAEVVSGGRCDPDTLTIEPTILVGLDHSMQIMEEEIFGPVLPVLTYRSLSEITTYLQARPKPLAMYIFTRNLLVADELIARTSAGGTCVNDVVIQCTNPNLPFGGVNSSGTGSSHGHYGFKAFSHERAVMYQAGFDLNGFAYPPYSGKENQLNWLKKLL